MALEAGCGWITLGQEAFEGLRGGDLRAAIAESGIVDMCREAGAILTISNDAETARELSIHGVLLEGSEESPGMVREKLGPEAIIGVKTMLPGTIAQLPDMDIDYAVLDDGRGLDACAAVIEQARGGMKDFFGMVIEGDFTADNVAQAMATGANGVAVTAQSLLAAADPVEAIKSLLQALGQ